MTVLGSAAFASGCYLGAVALERQFYKESICSGVSMILPALALWAPLIGGTGAMVALAGVLLRARWQATVVFGVVPLLAFIYVFVRAPYPSDHDLLSFACRQSGGKVGFLGEALSAPAGQKLTVAPILLEFPYRQKLMGKTSVIVYGGIMPVSVQPGSLLRVRGRVKEESSRKFSWEPDFTIKSIRDGVYTVCFSRSGDIERVKDLDGAGIRAAFDTGGGAISHEASLLLGALEKKWSSYWTEVRRFIVDSHCRILGECKGRLLSSIVIGDRAVELDKTVKDQFRTVGLSHLLAASGFNLSILVGCVYFLSRSLIRSRLLNCACGCLATIFFVCLAGPSPSVLRAAIMCLLLLAARAFFSRVHVCAALALTLIIALLIEPLSVADVGLQMSYAATASIICGARPLAEYFKLPLWLPTSRFSDGCADLAAVIILAQAGVLPLQLVCFWVLGLLFLPANFLVDPVIAPITICGFISSTLAVMRFSFSINAMPIVVLERWLDWLVSTFLDYILFVSRALAQMPLASINVGPPSSFSIVGYYLALGFFISTLRSRQTAVLGLAVFMCALSLLLWRAEPEEFVAFDGDAMLSPTLGYSFGTGKESWHLERIKKYAGLESFPAPRGTGDALAQSDARGELICLESRSFRLLARKNRDRIGPVEVESVRPFLAAVRAQGRREKELLIWVRGGSTFLRSKKGTTIASSSRKGKPLVVAYGVNRCLNPELYRLFFPFKRIERNRGSPFVELR